MSSPSTKVVVVQRDRRVAAAVRLGFAREGLDVVGPDGVGAGTGDIADDTLAALVDGDTALVVAGAEGGDAARSLLEALRKACGAEAPLLWLGNGVEREEAWAAGADEVLAQPAYLRDVVTIGKLLSGRKRGNRQQVSGDLGDHFGVFYLARALAATGRSGVLTLVRGLRRGEVRFFEGEVTSAHMGGLHGQAGFHQLLLWSEARFEWRHEPVVRRRQIPMDHDEVLAQAERFLGDIREVAGGLSPAAVYEQDGQKIQAMAKKLPTEVHGVLRLFDGNRTLADVLEDSPFRVFETLRVALRAVEVGLLRRVQLQRPKAALRAVLAVEEWLVGNEPREAAIDRAMAIPDTAPSPKLPDPALQGQGQGQGQGKKKNKHKKRKDRDSGATPALVQEIDWNALVPRATNVDMSAITGVVPSASTSGEIMIDEMAGAIIARREGREGLEALTDTEQRKQMFPTVSVDFGEEPVAEPVAETAPMPVVEAVPVAVRAVETEPETAPVPLVEPVPLPVPVPVPDPVLVAAAPEPQILNDLDDAHRAIAAIAEREHARATSPTVIDAHDPATSAQISGLRKDVVAAVAAADPHFSDDEESFFAAGQDLARNPKPKLESFDDLDEGYTRETFWDRLRGKAPTKPPAKPAK